MYILYHKLYPRGLLGSLHGPLRESSARCFPDEPFSLSLLVAVN